MGNLDRTTRGISRRRVLEAGLGSAALFLSSPHAWVWAQSEGATKLLRASKVALVVGNGGYRNVPGLRNPVNDAKAIAAALTDCGFDVVALLDAERAQMARAISDYVKSVASKKAVGLFYFAGHGLQLAWRNYLLPVDASIHAQQDIPAQSIDVGALVGGIGGARNPMNVIILDACRNNPFGDFRVEQKGLSQMDAPPETLLAYSTAPGNVAADGDGANGLYTEKLLHEMKVREAKIEDVFKRVRLAVRRASKGEQIPWESTSLEEDFYFLPPESLKKLSRSEEERAFAEELAMFEKARDSKDAAQLVEYLRRYPSGRFSELAQLQLDRVLAAQGEKAIEPAPQTGNPNTAGTARADTRFRVGDRYSYRETDRRTGRVRENKRVVTAIDDLQVIFSNGFISDHLGNWIRWTDGSRFTPNQQIPLEYAVGRRWSTRFEVFAPNGQGTVQLDFRIAAREKITVPAGTFDAFRIEGHGFNENVFRPPIEIELKTWRDPERVRVPIVLDDVRRSKGDVLVSRRVELVAFRQA